MRLTRLASCAAGAAIILALASATTATAATVTSVSAAHEMTCALYADGTVACWGGEELGGNGSVGFSSTPVLVRGISSATAISVGEFSACALLADGSIECWGVNLFGELGNGSTVEQSLTPVVVSGVSNAIAVSVGLDDACALLAGGTVDCWGGNTWGELGNGTTTNSSTPVPVSGLSEVAAIGAGFEHNCAVLSTGTVECWGNNQNGALGNGTTTSSSTPVVVSGLNSAVAVSGGLGQTCAVLSGGTVDCWGGNAHDELGNESVAYSSSPIAVSGLSNVIAVSAGEDRTCAVLSDGTAECWGSYFLGNGTANSSFTPVIVSGSREVVGITAGFFEHSCAVLADGTAECWGRDESGQLGNGATTESWTPVLVSDPVMAPSMPGPEPEKVTKEGGTAPAGSTGTGPGSSTPGLVTSSHGPKATPKAISAAAAFSLPSAKQCVSRRKFTIHVRTLSGITWVSATIKINGKRIKTVGRSHITALVNLVGLPKGTFVLSITAKASDGQTVTGRRTYHTCVPKSKSHYPTPKL